MKKRYVFVNLIAIFLPLLSFSQNTLAIHNPEIPLWWGESSDYGHIEEASITMRPQGLYAEVELEMTIGPAYQTASWQPDDSLEIVYHFELPTNTIVYDSYLWIDDAKVQAFVLERSYGISIYESIVERQQDPSVLLKNRDGKYELRVYPLRADETRKLEIDYLVPITWHDGMASAELPVEVLRASNNHDFPLTVRIESTSIDQEFSTNNPLLDLSGGGVQEVTLPFTQLQVGNVLQWPMPVQDGLWVNVDASEQEYQLLFDPQDHLPQPDQGRNIILSIAHQNQNSQLSEAELRHLLISAIEQHSRPNDRYGVLTLNPSSETSWPESSLLSPEAAIQYLLYADLSISDNVYAQYQEQLTSAIEMVQTYATQPTHILEIIGLSSGNYYYSSPSSVLNALNSAENRPQIHIWNNSLHESSIEYGYELNFNRLRMIAASSNGSFLEFGSQWERLASLFTSMEHNAGFIELELAPQNGFNYQNYRTNGRANELLQTQPIMEVGKYAGDDAFEFQANVLINDIPMVIQLVPGVDTEPSAALHRIWAGSKLAVQEKLAATGSEISAIVQESIEERILTLYTIMLCLDPAIVTIDDDCPECPTEDEPLVGTDEVDAARGWSAKILENPSHGRLQLQWDGVPPSGPVIISIFNANGAQLLTRELGETFQEEELFFNQNLRFALNGNLAAGIYFVQIRTEEGVQTLRWVVVQ